MAVTVPNLTQIKNESPYIYEALQQIIAALNDLVARVAALEKKVG